MIELKRDKLLFSFPEVHPSAKLTIELQRTLRIPDDDDTYPLPPGLGCFPLRHVDDFASRVPGAWIEHGGVAFPMYQSEAMWLNFTCTHDDDRAALYPFAIKIATGKVCAVSGEPWRTGLHRRGHQNYVVAPDQPWLDGYCVGKGVIRQFVAMPLGAGYSAEEQVTGRAQHGGLQVQVFPMKRETFERRFPEISYVHRLCYSASEMPTAVCEDMSLAPGGSMRQEIYDDPYDVNDWDQSSTSRCFIHIANSMTWCAITGEDPPTTPPTAHEYTRQGLPWFEWYGDSNQAAEGSTVLAGMKSIVELGKEKGDVPLPENQSVSPANIVELRAGLKRGQVREWKDTSSS